MTNKPSSPETARIPIRSSRCAQSTRRPYRNRLLQRAAKDCRQRSLRADLVLENGGSLEQESRATRASQGGRRVVGAAIVLSRAGRNGPEVMNRRTGDVARIFGFVREFLSLTNLHVCQRDSSVVGHRAAIVGGCAVQVTVAVPEMVPDPVDALAVTVSGVTKESEECVPR